ncbi:MAG: homocysteine S-methyltransferase family protein [Desulfotignum sp.]|nr:homocysteine S-methyltransferase family protein [Desulfotignum sp.]
MDIIEKIDSHGLLLDGAMGSMLISHGLAGNDSAESWNIKHPEIIAKIHQEYFDAGLCAVQAIQSVSRKPVFCTLTFKETPKGFFTIFGNAPENSMKALADHGAAAPPRKPSKNVSCHPTAVQKPGARSLMAGQWFVQ